MNILFAFNVQCFALQPEWKRLNKKVWHLGGLTIFQKRVILGGDKVKWKLYVCPPANQNKKALKINKCVV